MTINNQTQISKLEKGRAEFAYKKVKSILDKEEKLKKECRSYVKKLPQMILSNGLGQSLAFVLSKKKDGNAYDVLYKHISEYMESDNTIRISKDKGKDIVEWIISLDSLTYRYVTEEVLAFLNWLRRFAEGMIEVSEGDKNENQS